MRMAAKFTRLVRFADPKGNIHYGEAGSDWKVDLLGRKLPTYDITDPWASEFALTGHSEQVAKVGCPRYMNPLRTWLRTHRC